jgi:hypothetical protein
MWCGVDVTGERHAQSPLPDGLESTHHVLCSEGWGKDMTSDNTDLEKELQQNLQIRRELRAELAKVDRIGAARLLAARLGNVFFWLACVLAALVLLIGGWVIYNVHPESDVGKQPLFYFGIIAVAAIVIWLLGRGLRYVLVGRSVRDEDRQISESVYELKQRLDVMETRLSQPEETIGPQLKAVAALLHQALSKLRQR